MVNDIPLKAEKNGRGKHPNSLKNLRPYAKGVSGNPGGLPGTDVAAVIARRVIEDNAEGIYQGFAKKLCSGDAHSFSVLADRGYGKVGTEGVGPIAVQVVTNVNLPHE